MVVLEATGDCNSADPDIAIYYEVIDRFLGELDAGECSDILSAIVACDPKSGTFLNFECLSPQYALDDTKLKLELPLAFSTYINHDHEFDMNEATISSVIEFLLPMKVAFAELLKLLQVSLTIPVTTATCERSFSVLKRIKSYLRSTMGQTRLYSLALLGIEVETTNKLDLDRVVDIFAADKRVLSLKHHSYHVQK